MAIKVVNKRSSDFDVYIGRGSKWGNPFMIGRDGSRQDVIEQFEQYLTSSPELMAALPELNDKVLGCFCKPKACHGDILKYYAEGQNL
jgi:hypothetical protein